MENTRIYPNELYDLAFELKEAKLWEELSEREMFAVECSNGTVCYCLVAKDEEDENGELTAYLGRKGLDRLRFTMNLMDLGFLDSEEVLMEYQMFRQECIRIMYFDAENMGEEDLEDVEAYCEEKGIEPDGTEAYPCMKRCRIQQYPWYLKEEDFLCAKEVMEAALEVAFRLYHETREERGFVEGIDAGTEIPMLKKTGDSFLWKKEKLPGTEEEPIQSIWTRKAELVEGAKKAARNGKSWLVDLFWHSEPVIPADEDSEEPEHLLPAPVFPYVLLILDEKTEKVVYLDTFYNIEHYGEIAGRFMMDAMIKNGVPSRIKVRQGTMELMLAYLCENFAIPLKGCAKIEPLRKAKEEILEEPEEEREERKEVQTTLEDIIRVLRNPESLEMLPDSFFEVFEDFIGEDILPEDAENAMIGEMKRRGLK